MKQRSKRLNEFTWKMKWTTSYKHCSKCFSKSTFSNRFWTCFLLQNLRRISETLNTFESNMLNMASQSDQIEDPLITVSFPCRVSLQVVHRRKAAVVPKGTFPPFFQKPQYFIKLSIHLFFSLTQKLYTRTSYYTWKKVIRRLQKVPILFLAFILASSTSVLPL